MTPIQDLQRRLLAGAMICEYTDPRGYQILADSESRKEIVSVVEALGYQLHSLGENSVFFLSDQDEPSESMVSAALETVTRAVGPVFQLFDALVRCAGDDLVFTPGYVLDKDLLLMQVNKQDALKKNLEAAVKEFKRANQALANNSAMLDAALKKLHSDGYLVMDDTEKERYRVTGKVCYLQQILDYIAEREIIDVDEDDVRADQSELEL